MDEKDLEQFKAALQADLEEFRTDLQKEIEDYKKAITTETEQYKYKLQQGLTEYGARWSLWADGRLAAFQAVTTFASAAIKGVMFANGGAAIAMLAFIGSLISSKTGVDVSTSMNLVAESMRLFVFGVWAGVACACSSYVAQVIFAGAEDTTISKIASQSFRGLAVALGFAGLVLFGWGATRAVDAFMRLA